MKIFNRVLLLIMMMVPAILVQGQSRKAEKMIDRFMEAGIWKINYIHQDLIKWEDIDVLKYHIDGQLSYLKEKHWNKFLDEITQLTGLQFVRASSKEESQIRIYFGDLEYYFNAEGIEVPTKFQGQFAYWSNRNYNSKKQLSTASFCIATQNVDNTSFGAFYVRKMFLQSLGLLGESSEEISIFYKYFRGTNYKLSKADKYIVKLMYQPNLKNGMTYKEVEDVLKNEIDLEAFLDAGI